MAVRIPMKMSGDGFKDMSTAEITAIKNQCRYLYGTNPSVDLSRVSSGGNLGTINDTRKMAGAYRTHVSSYYGEGSTAEPGTKTVGYARITQGTENTSATADSSSVKFPVYRYGDGVRSMTLTDMYDTFIYPAIDTLTNGSDQPGTYRIHTSTSLSGHTRISSSTVFADTRANVGAYTASGIQETLDQPTTITNYYLFRTNAGSSYAYPEPVYLRTDYNAQAYSAAAFDAILFNCMRHVASEVSGSRIRYRLNGAGSIRGSGMTDTRLNGSGNYQQRYVNTNDYRSQEFPNGSAVTQATNYLRIYQV